jgi:hypothetical protein
VGILRGYSIPIEDATIPARANCSSLKSVVKSKLRFGNVMREDLTQEPLNGNR